MTTPNPLPRYIYKIVPSTPPLSVPLPVALPISDLDKRDNFIHLSTSAQILGTLRNFFSETHDVYVLRIPYERVSKYIIWEDAKGKQPDEPGGCWDIEGKMGFFPHVHGNGLKIGREEVDEVGVWEKADAGWGVGQWPFEEDIPKDTMT